MKYGNRSLWKRIIGSPITLGVLIIAFFILVKATLSIHAKASLSETKLSQVQVEYTKLSNRQTDLTHKVEYLSTDHGLESEIRAKYRAVKEGESVAVILDNNQQAGVITASTTIETIKRSWWKSLLRSLMFWR